MYRGCDDDGGRDGHLNANRHETARKLRSRKLEKATLANDGLADALHDGCAMCIRTYYLVRLVS